MSCSPEEAAWERRFAFPRRSTAILLLTTASRDPRSSAGRDPKALQFQMGAYGKPFLLDEVGTAAALRFSLSHSGDHATIAVAWVREVGVDIESSREGLNELELAQRFFSPAEARQVAEVEGETRRRLFHRYTAKEAFPKGRGTGLAEGLQRFTVQWETDRQGSSCRAMALFTRPSGTSEPWTFRMGWWGRLPSTERTVDCRCASGRPVCPVNSPQQQQRFLPQLSKKIPAVSFGFLSANSPASTSRGD
ncbi:MAG: 4'-phosphopantetheinyl transferase superfamily protein [Nitrospiraceae bacterium]